jgi:UDP-N-acetylmuramoyl-L-alanyl-D-glutamate--2,6-diaminopimelate ligase
MNKVSIYWQGFKKSPVGGTIRKLSPQWMVNFLEHYPLAVLASVVYLAPSRKIKVIGVTGTDGKTTTVNMIYQILKAAGKKVSMISTINAYIGETAYETGFHVTSPHPFTVQQLLKKAVQSGSEYIVLEVTSNGLDQFRFWGIKFDIGVITNITHDHLDYHKTWENYFQAKAKLIKDVRVAVLNHDETHFERLRKLTKGKVSSFGLTKESHFNPHKFPVKLKILGDFNIQNALAASAACVNLGIDSKVIKQALSEFTPLTGRMEEISNDLGIRIFIDFAHTPNALDKALRSLKKLATGRLISVFGAASERDVLKRPLMGELSAKTADITILTSEDPRNEDPDKIIDQIVVGAKKGGGREDENFFREPDREKAIKMGLKMAKKGDLVAIFGKGHEQSMNIKGVETEWSDKEAVIKSLDKADK